MRLISFHPNTAFGQWANCLAFLHIGSLGIVLLSPCPFTNRARWYGTGVELFTPTRRFRFRLGGYCDERRKRLRARAASHTGEG
jgi:hypothetical protein